MDSSSAVLASNRGGASIVLTLHSPADFDGTLGVEASVRIQGEHWDGDHTFPLRVSVENLWLGSAHITVMLTHIQNWIDLPIEQLATTELVGEFALAAHSGQELTLNFGPRVGVIASRNPVVSVQLVAGTLRTQFHFVTDQSCLRLFADNLRSALLACAAQQCATDDVRNARA